MVTLCEELFIGSSLPGVRGPTIACYGTSGAFLISMQLPYQYT